jgi:hypothetical protein
MSDLCGVPGGFIPGDEFCMMADRSPKAAGVAMRCNKLEQRFTATSFWKYSVLLCWLRFRPTRSFKN